jgi:hypothetical protein
MLRFAVAFALRGARKLVRGLQHELDGGVPLAWRRQIVFEPPGVATLLKLVNDVVGNAKPLCFADDRCSHS